MTFEALSQYFFSLEKTPSRNQMTELLSEVFRRASGDEIAKIVYLLLGRVAPLFEAIEFGVAEKFMIRAIAQAYGVDEAQVLRAYKKEGDLGNVAEMLHPGKGKSETTVSVVFEALKTIATTGGTGSQEKKITLLSALLAQVTPLGSRYVARIPVGKLRLGFSDMTILDALSYMVAGDKSKRDAFEAAYSVRPDIGFIARSVKENTGKHLGSIQATFGAPILASLCQRLPTADEMIRKMGQVAVEPKYDGERVQIHAKRVHGSRFMVHCYSRNLENITAMFPELAEIGKHIQADEIILDSEAVGVDPKTGKLFSFQDTMTRKRKHAIAENQASVPLRFFVFDILAKNGTDLLSLPLSERRALLEKTVKRGSLLDISPQIITTSADEIRSYHDQQIKRGLEGVIIKKWQSPYEPGRRGFSWVKFKEEEGKTGKLTDTIDAVVMGYYKGKGKRTGFGIGAFLVGVKENEGFVTVTKIGTGVSDELWKELRGTLHAIQAKEKPKEYLEVNKLFTPDVWVEPKIVVEVAGDDLTRSPSHGARFAVRFPRLVRIRADKGPAQATTVREIGRMYANQKTVAHK